ncbi:hypothetical protein ACOSQ4_029511 [Xanthoceras sorbifolium]
MGVKDNIREVSITRGIVGLLTLARLVYSTTATERNFTGQFTMSPVSSDHSTNDLPSITIKNCENVGSATYTMTLGPGPGAGACI